MPRRNRRTFTTDQKVTILRRHHIEKVAISDICTEQELQPSVFYYWQRQAFENLASAFQPAVAATSSREKELEREVEVLKARLAKKDSVIASISEEYVTLKKHLGSPPSIGGWEGRGRRPAAHSDESMRQSPAQSAGIGPPRSFCFAWEPPQPARRLPGYAGSLLLASCRAPGRVLDSSPGRHRCGTL